MRYLLEYTPGRDCGSPRGSQRNGQLTASPRSRQPRSDSRPGAQMSGELKRELQKIQAPDELDAQRRAWPLVRAALEAREPIEMTRRSLRPLLAAAIAVADPGGGGLAARPRARGFRSGRGYGRERESRGRSDLAAGTRPAPGQFASTGRGSCNSTARSVCSAGGGRARGHRGVHVVITRGQRSPPCCRTGPCAGRSPGRATSGCALVARGAVQCCRIAYLTGASYGSWGATER